MLTGSRCMWPLSREGRWDLNDEMRCTAQKNFFRKGELSVKETGVNALMKIVLRFFMVLVGVAAGYQIAIAVRNIQPELFTDFTHPNVVIAFCVLIFAFIGFIITPLVWWLLKKIGQLFENMLQNVSAPDITVMLLSLTVSLLLANLIAIPFRDLAGIGFYIAIGLNIIFAFVGMRLSLRWREAIIKRLSSLFSITGRISQMRDKKHSETDEHASAGVEGGLRDMPACRKVVDTSALIDGRILDIAGTGFLEGTLILPRFVLTELQGVADSSDPVRRARGRKGLAVVSELQKHDGMAVVIDDTTMKELKRDKVDEALVELCKRLGAKILTMDFNLNQVSRIEGVRVLNINELANSLKPQFLPGDVVSIDVLRHGKERGQGVGYLEDGTLLVVEDGEDKIGERVEITITSMLQTSAGRMVFGKVRR